jgi:hypothetical protein
MNYAIVVLAFVILMSISYYHFSARRWFKGPKQISVEEQEREKQIAALGQDEKLKQMHGQHIQNNAGDFSDLTTPDSSSADLKVADVQVEQVDRP